MKQLILPINYNGEEFFNLPQKESHYLINVQRRSIGYQFDLQDSKGSLYRGVIIDIVDGLCSLKLTISSEAPKKEFSITMLQGIPKGKKIDLMIRQSVEAGVDHFYPIMADHSIPIFNSDSEREKKRERWYKIVKEAAQQSGTKDITTLEELQTLKDALNSIKKPFTGIFFHQVPLENMYLHQILEQPEENIVLVIGPEGGLSQKEVNLLIENNFKPALLGDNILRAETATTFALGAVQIILNERKCWKITN